MSEDLETPDRILDAAEELIATQGYAATTTKQIGAAAGVNPALIHYYFGNKEGLYRAVLKRLFAWYLGGGAAQLAPAPSPPEAVRALLGFQARALGERSTIPRLVMREMMEHGGAMAGEHLAQLAGGLFQRVCDLIEEGQKAGIFRRDLDARLSAMSAASMVPFAHVARPLFGYLLGRGADGPTREDMDAYARHAADFVLAALTAPGREGERPGEAGPGGTDGVEDVEE